MNEIKSFYIDRAGFIEKAQMLENIGLAGEGLRLQGSVSFGSGKMLDIGPVVPGAISVDRCGTLYMVNTVDQTPWKYEMASAEPRVYPWMCGRAFTNLVSLAVTGRNLYIVGQGDDPLLWRLYGLALGNGQICWERPVVMGTRVSAWFKYGNELLFLFQGAKKLFLMDRPWDVEDEGEEVVLYDENGFEVILVEPRDIAIGPGGFLYVLDGVVQEGQVLKFRIDEESKCGTLVERVVFPFRPGVSYEQMAVLPGGEVVLVYRELLAGPRLVCFGLVDCFSATGVYTSQMFDSTIPMCRWHRVLLDADIPVNTQVHFSYIASDSLGQVMALIESQWVSLPLGNPRDALLIQANGRYFRFRLEISSDENQRATPLIRALQLYFPRETYLQYLPATYQEDEGSRDFLERYLSLFHSFFSRSEEEIEQFTRYLDPVAAPAGFVPFLASWLAIAADENWSIEARRTLIRLVPLLYRIRGTRSGIVQWIELYLGRVPVVIEPFQLDCIESEGHRQVVNRLYGSSPYCFAVLIEPVWEDVACPVKRAVPISRSQLSMVKRIVEQERPAYTSGTVKVLEPWFYLDMHTYLEVNTVLTRPRFILEYMSVIGRDTVLGDMEECGQVGNHSRMGLDFKIK